jgi:indolepyruvate ferredoxin oxidoreductase alpha subunit
VIAAGFAYQKLMDLLGGAIPPELRILRLGTIYPLPVAQVVALVRQTASVLVLEETAPLLERAVRAAVQAHPSGANGTLAGKGAGLCPPIYGRDTGHVRQVGELFAPHIAAALNRFLPGLDLPAEGKRERPMPSREPLCDGCPYVPAFDALVEAIDRLGGRDAFIVVGDPGCMVRAQSPPYKLLDVKASLGSSLGIAAGIALSQRRLARPERSPGNPAEGTTDDTGKRVVALCGDSSFLHSGFSGLVDAARTGVQMLVLILDNGTTALSGGQPHPASRVDARGQPRPAVDLAALARDAGADVVRVVDLDRGEDVRAAIEMGMDRGGVAVVIARGRCPRWPMRG